MATHEENVSEYLSFVQEQIDKFKKNVRLISDDHITPEAINRALAEFQEINSTLIAEYQRAKMDQYKIESEFQDFWDSEVAKAREEILSNIEGKKYPAYKEYELLAKQRNYDRYRDFQDRLKIEESRVAFLRRLLESFKKQDNILVNLSLNTRSELKALSLEDRANSNPKKRKARRTVSTES